MIPVLAIAQSRPHKSGNECLINLLCDIVSRQLRLVICLLLVADYGVMANIVCLFQHIDVPETLLKKRKNNEKAREERLAAVHAARKVKYTDSTTFSQ